MTIKKAIEVLKKWYKLGNEGLTDERLGYVESWFSKEDKETFILAINVLCCFDQILWERDTALKQLKELGYSLGEKKKTCEMKITITPKDVTVGALLKALMDKYVETYEKNVGEIKSIEVNGCLFDYGDYKDAPRLKEEDEEDEDDEC